MASKKIKPKPQFKEVPCNDPVLSRYELLIDGKTITLETERMITYYRVAVYDYPVCLINWNCGSSISLLKLCEAFLRIVIERGALNEIPYSPQGNIPIDQNFEFMKLIIKIGEQYAMKMPSKND